MKYKQIRVSGIVIPSCWDDDGGPTAVSVATAKEAIELVADKIAQKELIGLIHKEVEIIGLVRKSGGKKTILVVDYFLKPRPAPVAAEHDN